MRTVFLALMFGVLTAWFVVELVVDGLRVWGWLAFAMLLLGWCGLARGAWRTDANSASG